MLNISYLFSILVSRLVICTAILFSWCWIIFIIIILNSFSGRFPISSSLVWLGGHFSWSFTYWVFLWLFILFRLLCLERPFYILIICGSLLLWRFLPVGGAGCLVCWGLLVREACVGVLVGGAGFLFLECNGMSSSEFWDESLCLVWLWAACMLMLRAMFLCCWRICEVCLALKFISSWVVVCFSVGMESLGWSLITYCSV